MMKRSLLAFALVLIPSLAHASDLVGPASDEDRTVTVSSAAFTTLSLSTSKTTDAIYTQGYRFLKFDLTYVYSAATAVTMTCKQGATSTTADKTIDVLSYTGSTAASAQKTWSKSISAANAKWTWTVRLRGYNYVVCTFSGTGAAAGDTLTVTGVAGN